MAMRLKYRSWNSKPNLYSFKAQSNDTHFLYAMLADKTILKEKSPPTQWHNGILNNSSIVKGRVLQHD